MSLAFAGDDGKEAVPWISLAIDRAGLHDASDCVRAYLVDQLGLKSLEERMRTQKCPLVNATFKVSWRWHGILVRHVLSPHGWRGATATGDRS